MKFEKGDVVYDFCQDQYMIFKFYVENELNGFFDAGHNGNGIMGTIQGMQCVFLISKADFA